MILDAPEHGGLYALWRGDELLHLGQAAGGDDTIRARLMMHFWSADGRLPVSPTHYSWEICADPAAVRAQWLAELGADEGRAA